MELRTKRKLERTLISMILIFALVITTSCVYAQEETLPGGEQDVEETLPGQGEVQPEEPAEPEGPEEQSRPPEETGETDGGKNPGRDVPKMEDGKQEIQSQSEIDDQKEKKVELRFRASSESADAGSGARITVFTGAFSDDQAPMQYGNYYLKDAEAGDVFTYRVSAAGCYTYEKAEVLTEADIKAGRKEVLYTLDRKAGGAYEAKTVNRWPENIEKMFFDSSNLKNVDRSLLDTPAFSTSKAAHQFTSIEEGTAYLQQVCSRSSQAYLYDLEENSNCPVVVLTSEDLSGAANLSEAVSSLSGNGKMKVMYQAQIHGNEPGSGEGALAVCKGLSRDSSLLSAMDIVVIPYVNTLGAKNFTRTNGYGVNLNRDALKLSAQMSRDLRSLFQELEPEIFIDGHEFKGINAVKREKGRDVIVGMEDVKIACLEHLNRGETLFAAEKSIVEKTLDSMREKGFRTFFYPANWDSTTSCNYARMQNSLSFLIETNGIDNGKLGMERRVLSQYEAVYSILSRAKAKKKTIMASVKDARNDLIKAGKRYDKDHVFVLSHGLSEKDPMRSARRTYDFFGHVLDEGENTVSYNKALSLRDRSRPTAYIIPKTTEGKEAVKKLKAHGIDYFELKKGSRISVTQYTGTYGSAKVSKRKNVVFAKGAYAVYMDQPSSNIISALLEPDAEDSAEYEGSLVQSGVLSKTGSGFPIYRYTGRDPQKSLKKYR